jgi:4-hydroxy-tetrahydrodipicolinate synthase
VVGGGNCCFREKWRQVRNLRAQTQKVGGAYQAVCGTYFPGNTRPCKPAYRQPSKLYCKRGCDKYAVGRYADSNLQYKVIGCRNNGILFYLTLMHQYYIVYLVLLFLKQRKEFFMICRIPAGAMTALITPFRISGKIDVPALFSLIRFQISQGISGIVPAGTTGESPTLTEAEHIKIIQETIGAEKIFVLCGCGSNCTAEAMHYVEAAAKAGGKAVLLVDPYYNGPSSLEIRKEYYGPIAKAFPDIAIVPYIIPGRTGCKLMPDDLADLSKEFPNIFAVKEATGDWRNMIEIRAIARPEFQIFSGDDDKTYEMMTTPEIKACGVISVISNIAPATVQEMCQAILQGNTDKAMDARYKLDPLFKSVTVFVDRPHFKDKFRNPLPIKTMMNGLGMPAGPCRQPLGRISFSGVLQVRKALCDVWENSPEVLRPIESFFSVDIGKRLKDDRIWVELAY